MSQCIHRYKSVTMVLLLLAAMLNFWSCAKSDPSLEWHPGDSVVLHIGEHALQVELALTPAQQARGLMRRDTLAQDAGMLFVFDQPEPRSFWMKNTWIPLDIAYIDASGVIKEIHPLYPNNQNSVKSLHTDIQYALETNKNWFKNHNIKPGVKIDLNEVLPIMRDHGILSPLYQK